MQIVYQLIAGTCTAAFIAVVFYLLVFWQNPDVPVSTGFILGVGLTIYGIYRMVKAKTRSKRSDAHVLIFAGILLTLLTFILCITHFRF